MLQPYSGFTFTSANGSSVAPNLCNPKASKPSVQPKPLLPALQETRASFGVQAKAIVIPTLLTLPKQQPVVTIQPVHHKGM